jgi:hypothetical protein
MNKLHSCLLHHIDEGIHDYNKVSNFISNYKLDVYPTQAISITLLDKLYQIYDIIYFYVDGITAVNNEDSSGIFIELQFEVDNLFDKYLDKIRIISPRIDYYRVGDQWEQKLDNDSEPAIVPLLKYENSFMYKAYIELCCADYFHFHDENIYGDDYSLTKSIKTSAKSTKSLKVLTSKMKILK